MDEINPFLDVSAPISALTDPSAPTNPLALSNLNTLSVGASNTVLHFDKSGLWLGAAKFADAPFSVDMNGNMTALSGNISANINLGGTNNNNGVIKIFNASGQETAQGDNTGFTVFNLNSFNFYDSSVGAIVATLGADGTSNVAFNTRGPGIGLKVNAPFTMSGNASVGGNLTVSGTLSASSFNPPSISTGSLTVSGNNIFENGMNLRLFRTGGGGNYAILDNPGGIVLIDVGGVVKSAIVPASQGYQTLYCTESPEVWFMDFTKDGAVDPLFLEVTEGEIHKIQCEDGEFQVWRRRKGFSQRFGTKTYDEFVKNNRFWSLPQT